jgi:ribosome-associated protein
VNWFAIKAEVEITAVRSRGPGGQNVNKVSSAARLVWKFLFSTGLSTEEKSIIEKKLTHRINQDAEIYLRADEFRDFPRNKAHCFERLHELLLKALHKDKPRRATKPTRASKLKKRESKNRRGQLKAMRRKVSY